MVDPAAAKRSLMAKVKRERITQDTGTGGAWPISSDRECWALAAWQVYLSTGDRQWLTESYRIISNSITDDEDVVIDPRDGLVRGETSFMDWREQTYPRWMQAVDIYESKSLSTNAVFFGVYRVLAAMAKELHLRESKIWSEKATSLQTAVDSKFWMPEKGLYGEYRYGPVNQALSTRTDALGETLSLLTGLAPTARRDKLFSSIPVMDFGVPTVYPQSAGIPPYHNRSVWPFVEALWGVAAAQLHDEGAVAEALGSIYRASALFLTNKENFVVDTGSPIGTAINSDRQLWSVAGNLAMTYRVLFGMELRPDGLHLNPAIPKGYGDLRTLSNYHYRMMTLTIRIEGNGSRVLTATLDGAKTRPFIPAGLQGHHEMVLKMGRAISASALRSDHVRNTAALDMPAPELTDGALTWKPVQGAEMYQILRDGAPWRSVTETSISLPESKERHDYQVAAASRSAPVSFFSVPTVRVVALETRLGSNALGYLLTTQTESPDVKIDFDVTSASEYVASFTYANGEGPINTDSKCAIRTLYVDGKRLGPIVMPQRGKGAWEDYGRSSSQVVWLAPGHHIAELRFGASDFNMDGVTNSARLRTLSLEPLEPISTDRARAMPQPAR